MPKGRTFRAGRRLGALLVAGMLLAGCAGPAWAGRLPVTRFTAENGLPGDRVVRIVLDSRGFLWSCHRRGLGRFDGERFRAYGVAEGLPPGTVHDLLETRDGTCLVATERGVYRLDRRGGRPPFRPLVEGEAMPAPVLALAQDSRGRIWAGSPAGLFEVRIGPGEGGFRAAPLPAGPGSPGAAGHVIALVAGSGGDLWVGTRGGLVHRDAGGKGRRFTTADGLPGDDVRCLLRDREGGTWVGTTSGLARLAAARQGAEPGVAATFLAGRDLPSRFVFALHEDGEGTIWVGSRGLVAIRRDGSGTIRWYSTAHGLGRDEVTALAEDAGGNLWVGTEAAGLVRITRGGLVSFGEEEGLAEPRISSILESSTGEILVTARNSLYRYRAGEDRFEPVGLRLPFPFSWGWYQVVVHDRRGEWWFATTGGLVRYPALSSARELAAARPVAVYREQDGLPGDLVFRLFEDSRGDLWIGTISRRTRYQLAVRDGRTGRFRRFGARDGIPTDAPTAFCEDRQGGVWIGFYRGTLARWFDGHFTFRGPEDGVPRGLVRALHVDRRGGLWVALGEAGVVHAADPTAPAPRFVRPEAEGLPPLPVVNAVAEDARGRLYFGTDRGIDRLDPETGQAWHYGRSDGLPNGFVNVATRARDGTLWFGTLHGLARLVPRDDPPRPPPPVYIDRVRIAGREYPVAEPGQRVVGDPVLGHRENRVQVDFVSVGHRAGIAPRWQYRLLGAGANWSEPSHLHSVDYANLAPGRYRFEVRAVNEAGEVSDPPAVFTFRIRAPFWRRGWFLGLAVLALAAVIAAAWVARSHVLERRRQELAREVARKTAELRAAKGQLEDYNRTLEERIAAGITALREAERMAAYGRLVAGVAHEVRHPIFSLQAAAWVLADKLRGNAELRQQLRVLERETRRLGALMDDLLAFARPRELHPEPVLLGSLLAEVVESDRQAHPDPVPRVVTEVDGEMPPVELDRGRMLQVLLNLVDNARRHAEGVTVIRLRARRDREDDVPCAILEVANDGAPIPAEVLPRIFEPFFTSGRGTGLGLAIVRRIVTAHGGHVDVRSGDAGGTVFTITLPLA